MKFFAAALAAVMLLGATASPIPPSERKDQRMDNNNDRWRDDNKDRWMDDTNDRWMDDPNDRWMDNNNDRTEIRAAREEIRMNNNVTENAENATTVKNATTVEKATAKEKATTKEKMRFVWIIVAALLGIASTTHAIKCVTCEWSLLSDWDSKDEIEKKGWCAKKDLSKLFLRGRDTVVECERCNIHWEIGENTYAYDNHLRKIKHGCGPGPLFGDGKVGEEFCQKDWTDDKCWKVCDTDFCNTNDEMSTRAAAGIQEPQRIRECKRVLSRVVKASRT